MTASPDARRLALALDRMGKAMFVMTAAGAITLLVWRGRQWSGGWLLGCAASTLNYRWLRSVIFSMGSAVPLAAGQTAAKRWWKLRPAVPRESAAGEVSGGRKQHKAVLFGLRYLLLGAGAYVILKYTAISLPAALAGLFIPAAAVIVEILIQLVYARN